jgi:hypothetical protein
MNTNNLKQFGIVLIASIGLYTSGNYLIEMPHIKTLLDGFNVMIFFTCFFPFLIVTIALISDFLKSINRLANNGLNLK